MPIVSFEQFVKRAGGTPQDVKVVTSTTEQLTEQQGYLSRVAETAKEELVGGGEAIQSGAELMGEGKFVEGAVRSGLGTAGAAVRVAFSPLTEALAPVVAPLIAKTGIAESEAMKNLNTWAEAHPDAAANLKDIFDIGTAIGGVKGTVAGVTAAKPTVEKGIAKGVEIAKTGAEKVSGTIGKTRETAPASIMNRVARVNPKEAQTFQQMSGGREIGQYLAETGNFNAPDKLIAKEAEKFATSLKSVDDALGKLEGSYKNGAITDVLKGLKEKAIATSGKNVKSPYFDQVNQWIKKYNTEGLTMGEINQVKRLYEREVKLGYRGVGAQMNPEAVQRATNTDTALRGWQVKKAEELGFMNIADLNKQTQLSKFIVDKVGNKIVSNDLLNNIGLTDWIVLSGGDPTAVGGFLTKRFFSSKNVQAKIAEILNQKEVKGLITPEIVPTRGMQATPRAPKR